MPEQQFIEGPDGSVIRKNYCGNCGRFSGTAVGMSPGSPSMSNISFSCQYCGHHNVGDEGVHSVERGPDGQLQWVLRELDADQIRELRVTLAGFLGQTNLTAEQVAAAVAPTSSALSKLFATFEDHQGLIGFISMVVTILGFILAACNNGQPPPPAQITTIVTQVQDGHVDTPGVHRNDKCPCGSGHKLKKCHGRPASADPPRPKGIGQPTG